MRAKALLSTLVAAIGFAHAAAADPIRLVYRVDSASAQVQGGRLVITANGAVRSGGWDKPRLLVLEPSAPEATTLEAQFVARPPAPKEVVVQSLLPVTARKVAKLPHYATTKVKIIAETNSLIVQIAH
jgi:hypothetical protein